MESKAKTNVREIERRKETLSLYAFIIPCFMIIHRSDPYPYLNAWNRMEIDEPSLLLSFEKKSISLAHSVHSDSPKTGIYSVIGYTVL